jgi:hypothetical protein
MFYCQGKRGWLKGIEGKKKKKKGKVVLGHYVMKVCEGGVDLYIHAF